MKKLIAKFIDVLMNTKLYKFLVLKVIPKMKIKTDSQNQVIPSKKDEIVSKKRELGLRSIIKWK